MIKYEAEGISLKLDGETIGRIYCDHDDRWAFRVSETIDLYPEELLDISNTLQRIEEHGVSAFLKG